MTAAIRITVGSGSALLYEAGTFDTIDWKNPHKSELGDTFQEFDCNKSPESGAISVVPGLDGNYVLRLLETKHFTLRVNGLPLPEMQNEGNKFLHLSKDKDRLDFQFINYLGRSHLLFRIPESNGPIRFEVVPDKMDYKDDYIRLTEAIGEQCASLLMDYGGATSHPYELGKKTSKTLLEQFIFLRQFCFSENIQSLFESIRRHPSRILVQDEEMKPFGQGIPSTRVFSHPFSAARGWHPMKGIRGKDWYLPETLAVTHKKDSLDTEANRFVKAALERFDTICINLAQALSDRGESGQIECLEEARVLHHLLDDILQSPFFEDVGPLRIMPQNNQTLLKQDGYFQIFKAFQMIDLALDLDWEGKDNVYEGEAKNVALLYEYWLFFMLFNTIKGIDGCVLRQVDKNAFLEISNDKLTVSLKESKESRQYFHLPSYGVKINLYYNRVFKHRDFLGTQYEDSYSRPFRPDYTLAIFPDSFEKGGKDGENEAVQDGAVRYVHFDAKYRVTKLENLVGRDVTVDTEIAKDLDEDKRASVVNVYKIGDLLKMHTYNDAIRRTVGSYVLYPGTGETKKDFHVFDEIIPGVGAFALKPSNQAVGMDTLTRFIKDIIASETAVQSRLNRMKYYSESVIQEPEVVIENNLPLSKRKDINHQVILGNLMDENSSDYYGFLKNNGYFETGMEFPFFFDAINGSYVYSHHPKIAKIDDIEFYANDVKSDGFYLLEPFHGKVVDSKLMSRDSLNEALKKVGYEIQEERYADFYYVLTVRILNKSCETRQIPCEIIDSQNGNDTFAPSSPKVISQE